MILKVLTGEHQPANYPRPLIYKCKLVIMREGFPEFFSYLGLWNGWKSIDPDASVYSWKAVS